MSEFRVHHHVSELMSLLGIKSSQGSVGAETYTETLLQNMTPYVTTQVSAHNAKRTIAENTQTPEEFLQRYDELKAKNTRDLDPLVFLLSKMAEDQKTKKFLEKHAKDQAAASGTTLAPHSQVTAMLPEAGSKLSPKEFSELRGKLLEEASHTSSHMDSKALRKVLREQQASRNVNLPAQPDWIFNRPYLTMDFVLGGDDPQDRTTVPLGSLPVLLQEQAAIEDLMFCMEGIEGKYIRALPLKDRYGERDFAIDQSLDPSLRELVKRILPLCSNYSIVVRFIEEKSAFEYGMVNHALSAAMRNLVKDYMVLVAQLEHQFKMGQLSLQKFWFYIQPTMRTMEILASVANAVNKGECIGGAVLSLLHEKTASLIGDVKGQELCLYLTQSACVPYFEILEKWIYKGIISDPYSEFLIEEDSNISKEKLQEDYNDAYWEQHYTIRRERIPVFLETVADKILNTGKYLNVVRLCGRDVKYPQAEEIVYTIKERQYVEHIHRAYSYASKVLLDLLMEEKELMARLRSIKHYFLMDQGDFVVQFLDMTEDEMKKDMSEIIPTRLETLLELALRTSTANADPFKDDLKVDLLPFDLVTQLFKILTIDTKLEKDYRVDPTDLHLSGLEAFSFDYVVKWPVSLVLNKKALTRYQMLFRHLFYCKHVERQLCDVWIHYKSSKQGMSSWSRWYASAFALRQRMLNFVQNFMYYMMFEVLEPNWCEFEKNMETVSTLDDVLAFHTDFLNICLQDCMLTNPDLLKILHKLMVVCVTFCNRLQSSHENTENTIANFDHNFSRLFVNLLDKITEFRSTDCQHKLMNILHRLDFNGFYTPQLEAAAAEKSMMEQDPGTSRSTSSASSGHQRPLSARSAKNMPGRPGGSS